MKKILIPVLMIITVLSLDILFQYFDKPHLVRIFTAYGIVAYYCMARKRFGVFGTFDIIIIISLILILILSFVLPHILRAIYL